MAQNTKLLENLVGSPSTCYQFFDFLSDVEVETGNYFTLAQKTGGSCVVSDDVHGGAMVITTTTTNSQGYNIIGTSLPVALGLGKSVAYETKIMRTEASAADIRKAVMWQGLGPADTDINGGAPANSIFLTTTADDGAATTSCSLNIAVTAGSEATVNSEIAELTGGTWYKVKIQIDMSATTAASGLLSVWVDDVLKLQQTATFPASTVFLGHNIEFLAASSATQNQILKIDYIGLEFTR